MKTIRLHNGVDMPVVGLGTWDLRGEACERTVCAAIEEGYRLIDTAQMYENEEAVGRAMRRSGVPREDLFVTTKLCRPSDGYAAATRDIEVSLRRLRTDYVDLLLIHEVYDDPQGMYRAFREALRAGKARAIGISNFMEDAYRRFVDACEVVPAVNQVRRTSIWSGPACNACSTNTARPCRHGRPSRRAERPSSPSRRSWKSGAATGNPPRRSRCGT